MEIRVNESTHTTNQGGAEQSKVEGKEKMEDE